MTEKFIVYAHPVWPSTMSKALSWKSDIQGPEMYAKLCKIILTERTNGLFNVPK